MYMVSREKKGSGFDPNFLTEHKTLNTEGWFFFVLFRNKFWGSTNFWSGKRVPTKATKIPIVDIEQNMTIDFQIPKLIYSVLFHIFGEPHTKKNIASVFVHEYEWKGSTMLAYFMHDQMLTVDLRRKGTYFIVIIINLLFKDGKMLLLIENFNPNQRNLQAKHSAIGVSGLHKILKIGILRLNKLRGVFLKVSISPVSFY